jgi:hypothetical protein
MIKVWKILNPKKYKNAIECINILKKKKIYVSPWIEDIVKNKKNKIPITDKPTYLFKIRVSSLGFKKPTQLKNIYAKLKQKGFKLVPPDIPFRLRLLYPEQKTGEWLRCATPMNSLIDSDGVPHLPKLGKALNKLFIETYWSYPKAIFHPHNEFLVCKYDI